MLKATGRDPKANPIETEPFFFRVKESDLQSGTTEDYLCHYGNDQNQYSITSQDRQRHNDPQWLRYSLFPNIVIVYGKKNGNN